MIAIVIPYYNYLFFEETLESLAVQTNKRFRVYIGDDCSPTDPKDILSKFQSSISLTYHRYDQNLGKNSLAEHWNRSISLINDESWILILGDDDKLDKYAIENFYKNIDEIKFNGSSVIRFSSVLIDEHSNITSQSYTHPKKESAKESLFRKLQLTTRSSLTEYVFSKDVFDKYKFKHYALAWHSDDIAWIQFSENNPIYTVNNAIAYIRFTKHSISGKQENLKLKVEATFVFFIDLLKMNLDYTNEEYVFLIKKFIFFLKLNEKFNFKTSIFLSILFFKRKQLVCSFSTIIDYLFYEILLFKKKIKKTFRENNYE